MIALDWQVFIEQILQQCGVNNVFSSVYTNPASFDADGCLSLKPFHQQDWCEISSVNMCKGHILDDHRQRGKPTYDLVAYVGDGANDLCPSLRLSPTDLVFARQGFTLAERIADVDGQKPVAKVVLWDTGFQILEALRGELSQGMQWLWLADHHRLSNSTSIEFWISRARNPRAQSLMLLIRYFKFYAVPAMA